jgi:hypothetical protein
MIAISLIYHVFEIDNFDFDFYLGIKKIKLNKEHIKIVKNWLNRLRTKILINSIS